LLLIGMTFLCLVGACSNDRATVIAPPDFVNSIGMQFSLIPAGSVIVGHDVINCDPNAKEPPRQMINITKPFYMSRHEVTQKQWQALIGFNPSKPIQDPRRPVNSVNLHDIKKFIDKLNDKEGGQFYWIPTRVQWEYAARSGTNGKYCFGDDIEKLDDYAWTDRNSPADSSRPVGLLKSSRWGLFDMHGNVYEWTQSSMSDESDHEALLKKPVGELPEKPPEYKLSRCWGYGERGSRVPFVDGLETTYRYALLGFRLARVYPKKSQNKSASLLSVPFHVSVKPSNEQRQCSNVKK